jgi:hypothetical protein
VERLRGAAVGGRLGFSGFRNTELSWLPSLQTVDPIPVTLQGGELRPL